MKHEITQGTTLAIVAGVVFGTAALLTRLIADVSPIAIAASRLTLGCLCMGGLILARGYFEEFCQSWTHRVTFIFLGILASFHFVLFVLAVQKTFIANALILVNTAPILVLILAPFVLKESVTVIDLTSVIVTFLGAGLIVGIDKFMLSPDHLVGDVCALGSAFCYAVYIIVARKLRTMYSSPVIMAWFFGLGAFFLWIGALITGDQPFSSPPFSSWIFLVLLGILPTGVGHFVYNLSLKYLPAAKASTIILLEPVSGTLLAWVFLHEAPPLITGVGILMVLVGIGMASFLRKS